jgi:hypothetical protein
MVDYIRQTMVENMTNAGGHHDDIMIPLISALASSFSKEWPIDIIVMVARYARSRSLVICGGLLVLDYQPYVMTINPFGVGAGLQSQWQLLPSFARAGYSYQMHQSFVYDNQIIVTLSKMGNGIQTYCTAHCTLPFNLDAAIAVPSLSLSSSTSSVPSSSLVALPSQRGSTKGGDVMKRLTNNPSRSVNGIAFESKWSTSLYEPQFSLTCTCVVLNNIIYRFDGDGDDGETLSYYHAQNKEWQPLPDIPSQARPCTITTSCIWYDRIYLLGARKIAIPNSTGHTNDAIMLCYQPSSHTWIDIPFTRSITTSGPIGIKRLDRSSLINIGDHIGILAIGGTDRSGPISTIDLYEPHHNRWTALPLTLPQPPDATCHHIRALHVDDGIVVLMGLNSSNDIWAIDMGQTIDEVRSRTVDHWALFPPYPFPQLQSPALFAL